MRKIHGTETDLHLSRQGASQTGPKHCISLRASSHTAVRAAEGVMAIIHSLYSLPVWTLPTALQPKARIRFAIRSSSSRLQRRHVCSPPDHKSKLLPRLPHSTSPPARHLRCCFVCPQPTQAIPAPSFSPQPPNQGRHDAVEKGLLQGVLYRYLLCCLLHELLLW